MRITSPSFLGKREKRGKQTVRRWWQRLGAKRREYGNRFSVKKQL